jgi:hypothetical protein
MNPLCDQLVRAYREEEALYLRALALVERQGQVMAAGADAGQVLELCRDVEAVMAQIAAVEDAIAPAKKEWEKARPDPSGELRRLLLSIERAIERVGEAQERVQRLLLEHVRRRQEQTAGARASINATRARRLYRAG